MDPLRPFADLIRSLWKSSAVQRSYANASATTEKPADRAADTNIGGASRATLESTIRDRLTTVGLSDAARAREAFVETVLAWELGDELPRDAAFWDVVKRVADHIGSDPRLGQRLQSLLAGLAEQRHP